MKNNSIQHLLAKRQTGTLTDSELEELNRLTHRDEVVDAAEKAAAGIVRRRRIATSAAAVIAIAVGTIGISLLMPSHETPLVAQQQPSQQPVVVEETPQTIEAPAEPLAAKPAATPKPAAKTIKDEIAPSAEEVKHAADPTVVCNNQCEADSVINDIWKFLTA